jgi:hypothetical protein
MAYRTPTKKYKKIIMNYTNHPYTNTCLRYIRNNRARTLRPGFIRFLAIGEIRHSFWAIPLFCERAANIAIDATEYAILRSRTNRRRYNRRDYRAGESDD